MFVQLYDVRVHADTTRYFTVPKYDIPIIKLLWNQVVGAKRQHGQRIEAAATGLLQPRNFHDEQLRVAREYATAADGYPGPASQVIYPQPDKLQEAYDEAVREGTAINEANLQRAKVLSGEADAECQEQAKAKEREAAQAVADIRAQIRAEILAEQAPVPPSVPTAKPARAGKEQ